MRADMVSWRRKSGIVIRGSTVGIGGPWLDLWVEKRCVDSDGTRTRVVRMVWLETCAMKVSRKYFERSRQTRWIEIFDAQGLYIPVLAASTLSA